MVIDNPGRTAHSQQNQAAVTWGQSQPPEELAGPEKEQRANPEGQKETESWQLAVSGADADCFPTHIRPFRSAAEYKLVKHTFVLLQHSGYYWGSMTMEEAHGILSHTTPGTFLIRDSSQLDVFFTLSYQSDDGPTSVRVQLNGSLLFSLCGSHRTFASLFALLTHYTGSLCKLTAPYRKQRPERLKQMCRRALIRTYGAENAGISSELSAEVKDYVHAYPYCI